MTTLPPRRKRSVAAGLTAVAILLYAVFYTLVLKRRTTQNIVWVTPEGGGGPNYVGM